MVHWVLALMAVASWGAPEGAPASSGSAAPEHFAVSAQFRAVKAAGAGEVAVTFAPRDPDVKINTTPPPRLKLDPVQKVLADKPGAQPATGPADEKYLDTTFPVVFPVTVLEPPRDQTVKGSLTYYYCSQRHGWCRKGTAELVIPVKAR